MSSLSIFTTRAPIGKQRQSQLDTERKARGNLATITYLGSLILWTLHCSWAFEVLASTQPQSLLLPSKQDSVDELIPSHLLLDQYLMSKLITGTSISGGKALRRSQDSCLPHRPEPQALLSLGWRAAYACPRRPWGRHTGYSERAGRRGWHRVANSLI